MITELKRIVGEDGIVESEAARETYSCDGITHHRRTPDAVVLPRSTEQVAEVVHWCAKNSVPFVPRGAGTGLSGGATPTTECVVISTARMKRILEIDSVDRRARVEVGVINADLTRATAPVGLHYAPDPSSQTACTIGGNVAENSGGPHCFKWGATVRHLHGLRVVLPGGEICDLDRDADPLDLVGLFCGSEGTLGIATEAVVRLMPDAPSVETLLASFKSLDDACACVESMVAAGALPSALECIDRRTIDAIEALEQGGGYPRDAEAVLLVELDGLPQQTAAEVTQAREQFKAHHALEVRQARDEAERLALWRGRKSAFGAMGRVAPDLYVQDAVVPRSRLAHVIREVCSICDRHRLQVANVFHAGDANLHPNISYDGRDEDEAARVRQALREILDLCLGAGGSLSGEHGIGLDKLGSMTRLFDETSLAVMDRVREAWDPARLANPGKAVPMPGGCSERGTPPAGGSP